MFWSRFNQSLNVLHMLCVLEKYRQIPLTQSHHSRKKCSPSRPGMGAVRLHASIYNVQGGPFSESELRGGLSAPNPTLWRPLSPCFSSATCRLTLFCTRFMKPCTWAFAPMMSLPGMHFHNRRQSSEPHLTNMCWDPQQSQTTLFPPCRCVLHCFLHTLYFFFLIIFFLPLVGASSSPPSDATSTAFTSWANRGWAMLNRTQPVQENIRNEKSVTSSPVIQRVESWPGQTEAGP